MPSGRYKFSYMPRAFYIKYVEISESALFGTKKSEKIFFKTLISYDKHVTLLINIQKRTKFIHTRDGIVGCHHNKYDEKGYIKGVFGNKINDFFRYYY